jgi:hypothetical protein
MPGSIRIFNSVGRDCANLHGDVAIVQQLINLNIPVPLRPIAVDGRCGSRTIFAIEEIQRHDLLMTKPSGQVKQDDPTFNFLTRGLTLDSLSTGKIAWGAKVSAAFKVKVIEIAGDVGVDPNFLMAAMAFESVETFSPSIKNSSSGATGLIQFMPNTAAALGTTTAALAAMTAEDQLDYVERYFYQYKNRLQTIEDVYMAILWPAAIGLPNSHVLFSKPSVFYQQNSGLDPSHLGFVTKEMAAARVKAKLKKGQGPGYYG